MLCTMFREWGYNCIEADDGDTAVSVVERRDFDAVLMDVKMARMSGLEAFARINQLKPSLPVIIMTAFSSVDDAVDLMKRGAHDYLTKPLDFAQVRQLIDKAFRIRRLMSETVEGPGPSPGGGAQTGAQGRAGATRYPDNRRFAGDR